MERNPDAKIERNYEKKSIIQYKNIFKNEVSQKNKSSQIESTRQASVPARPVQNQPTTRLNTSYFVDQSTPSHSTQPKSQHTQSNSGHPRYRQSQQALQTHPAQINPPVRAHPCFVRSKD